jgi:hypothetical protein
MTTISRKAVLRRLIVLPALASALAVVCAPAQAKGSKAQFSYQDTPNGKQSCSGCSFFIPAKGTGTGGTCKLVDGAISPNGWCTAFAAKA